MDQQKIIAALEGRARRLGLTMSEVCRLANVHPTTFSRWKKSEKNPDPIGATVRLLNAIDATLAEREAKKPRAARKAAA